MAQALGMNLIARILLDGRTSDFFQLKKEHFQDEEIQIYEAVDKHLKEHGILPTLEFFQRHHELSAPDSEDPYGVWHQEYIDRALYNRFNDLIPSVQRKLAQQDARAALDETVDFVETAHSIRTDGQRDVTTGVQFGTEVIDEFRRLRGLHGMSGIPTDWATLDATTHGLQNGDLILFAARPGVGKSTVAAKLTVAAHSHGYIPLLVSMEMKRVQIGARILGMQAGINMKVLRSGHMTTLVENRMTEAVRRMEAATNPMYLIEGQFRKSVNDLYALVHSLEPNLVIVDGAYLLKLPGASARMPLWERMGEIAQILKSMSITCNIPVIGTFQINREGGKKDKHGKDTGIEHLQLSDALGQLASLVVGIFKDEDTPDAEVDSHRRLKILKGREGERGEFYINYNFNKMDFTEIEQTQHNDWSDLAEGDEEMNWDWAGNE